MRSAGSATIAALQDPAGVVERDLVTVFALDLEGEPVTLGFWTDHGNVSMQVRNQLGATVTRDFLGDGSLLDVGDIPLIQTLDIRSVPLTVSLIAPGGNLLLRGSNLKNASVEIHRALFNVSTRLPVEPPYLHFVGLINKPELVEGAPGGESTARVDCVSDTAQLTRINHARRSLAHSLSRGGDKALQFVGTAAKFELWWGEKGSASSGLGGGGRNGEGGDGRNLQVY